VTRGKLYTARSGEFIVEVNYQLFGESEASWWGELVPTEYRRINDGEGFLLELDDGRRGRCSLRKRINRAVSGTPPLYHYQFIGRGRLD
jgi:hypothetical protein